jgi:hypothetical protein
MEQRQDLRVALVQTDLHWQDKTANLALLEEKIWSLKNSCDLIVLPEMFPTGFSMESALLAEPMNLQVHKWMKQLAAQTGAVITGTAIISEGGNYYNRLLWVLPDGSTQHYDKRHLFRMANEDASFAAGEEVPEVFMLVDEKGNLKNIGLQEVKDKAATVMAAKLHEVNLTLKQLFFLGLDDKETLINLGLCSAADVLQFALEKKLLLFPGDKDMIVMLHEIEYMLNGKQHQVSSSLVVTGDDHIHTAMAKTVGLPLGIAAKLILNGEINLTGLHIPILPEIYKPVLEILSRNGIVFQEINS